MFLCVLFKFLFTFVICMVKPEWAIITVVVSTVVAVCSLVMYTAEVSQ